MSTTENERRSKRLFSKAHQLQQKSKHQLSIDAYRELIGEFPDHALGHYNLGVALQAKKDDEAAFYAFQKVTQIDPKFTKAHINIGVLLEGQNRFIDAIAVYRQALDIDSTNAKLHANLCHALIQIKENSEAVTAGKLAVKFGPDVARAHNNLGLAYLNIREFELAEECFKYALSIESHMQLALGNMAVVLHRQHRLYQSRKYFKKVLREYPDFLRARVNYSWLLIGLGLWNESAEMSVSAMQLLTKEVDFIELTPNRTPPTNLYSNDCLEALVRFRNILARHKIELFLVYGTLLGCMRDKDFISYDTDIDVGIWKEASIVELIDELDENQFELRLNFNKNDSKSMDEVLANAINLPFYYKGRIPIDVYRHFPEQDKILSGFELGGHPLLYEVSDFELHEVDFLGELFQAPIEYETYLTECYGNWKRPDSLFETTVSSPNIVGGFPEHSRALAYHRAAAKLSDKKYEECMYILSGISKKEGNASAVISQIRKNLESKMR